jgi:hypothetical protein
MLEACANGLKADFDFGPDKYFSFLNSRTVYVVSDDGFMKIINVETKEMKDIEVSEEIFSVSVDREEPSTLVYGGGETKKVQMVKERNFEEPTLIHKFNSSVRGVKIAKLKGDVKCIMSYSEDSFAVLYVPSRD